MKKILATGLGLAVVFMLCMIQTAFGENVYWADWKTGTSGDIGTAEGEISLSDSTVSVNYHGEIYEIQTTDGTNYWNPSATFTSTEVSNSPSLSDRVALCGNDKVNTITFSKPVVNPVMAIVSMGSSSAPVQYKFSDSFEILSFGENHFGNGAFTKLPENILEGREGSGTVKFAGTFTSISWTVNGRECWQGFTVAVGEQNNTVTCNDSDGDGTADQWDTCPDTPSGSYVDKNGCPASGLYTQEQVNGIISAVLLWGDIDGDKKISLPEAIHALQVTSGITEPAIK